MIKLNSFITQHTLGFIAHSLRAGVAEMDTHPVGSLDDFLHKRGAFIFLRKRKNRTVCGADIGSLSVVHIAPFPEKPSIHEIKGLQRIINLSILHVWTDSVSSPSRKPGNSAYSRGRISGKANCMSCGFGSLRKAQNLTVKSRERTEMIFHRCYDFDIGSETNGLDSGYVKRY
jgi:hypothetical protein